MKTIVMVRATTLAVFALAGAVHAEIRYTVTNLGTLGGATAQPNAINASGVVTGLSTDASNQQHAFRWDSTNGMLPLPSLESSINTQGSAINASGLIIGRDSIAGNIGRAAAWSVANQVSMLNPLSTAPSSTGALGLNDAGVAVGFSPDFLNNSRAVLWNADGSIVDLGTLGGNTATANAVNNSGQVVGLSQITGSTLTHAFIYQGGQMTDLGNLGGAPGISTALAINASGQVVGSSMTAAGTQGFIWQSGAMTGVGLIAGQTGSIANAINDAGQVVGRVGNAIAGHAFFWDAPHGIVDLNTLIDPAPGVILHSALGINASGWIVATGTVGADPAVKAFLLRPITQPACYANCDGSTQAPILNVNDFTCFLNKYAAGDSYANCDGSTQAPILNVNDFTCFLNKYAAGCP